MFRSFNANVAQNPISLEKFAAINQTQAAAHVSSKYKFIPTTRALSVLADYGWHPVQANQSRTRKEELEGFQKHAIRLANPKFNLEKAVGSTVPQIVLTNSHAGTAAFELMVGLFEKVCANGLVVHKSDSERQRVRHQGYADEYMEQAIRSVMASFDDSLQQTDNFRRLLLSETEREIFARAAIELRFDGEAFSVEPRQMLTTYRREEREPNLYNTLNVVQEKVIRGGVLQRRVDNPRQRVRSREVKSITENIRLNKALWVLAEEMAKLKQG
jgi:hypothetical protein